MRRLLSIVCAVLLCLAAAIPARAAVSMAALNVQTADIPIRATFVVDRSGNPAALAKDPRITLSPGLRTAMVTGSARVFSLSPTTPNALLFAEVGRYTSAATAQAAFAKARKIQLRGTALALGALGDEAIGVRSHVTVAPGKPDVPAASVAFRRGTYVTFLIVLDPPKSMSLQQIVPLAHLIDARIAHIH